MVTAATVTRLRERGMRWEQLFDDLEAQLESDLRVERAQEVADRTRRDRASRDLRDRLVGLTGRGALVDVAGRHQVTGTVTEVGTDWVLLEGARPGAATLVPFHALRMVTVGESADPPAAREAPICRRLKLGHALRGLSRDRAPVRLCGVDGQVLTGTIDVVGSDVLELSEHPLDVPRRRGNVVAVRLVPFAAVALVGRGG